VAGRDLSDAEATPADAPSSADAASATAAAPSRSSIDSTAQGVMTMLAIDRHFDGS